MPALPLTQDFQFFDIPRLTALYEKDNAYEVHKHALAQVRRAPRAVERGARRAACLWMGRRMAACRAALPPQRPPPPPPRPAPQREAAARQQGASEETIQAEVLAPKDDDPQPLTEEELAGGWVVRLTLGCMCVAGAAVEPWRAWRSVCPLRLTPRLTPPHIHHSHPRHPERDELLTQGFSNWMRRDFNAFVRACEKYGRHALADVAREIESKTEEEVGGGG